MKYLKIILISLIAVTFITGCGNKKYIGYWCKYDEKGTIVITLKDEITDKQRAKVKSVIENFNGLETWDFIAKGTVVSEEYPDGQTNDTYIVYFSNDDTIDESKLAIEKLDGILEVQKKTIKANVSLYEFVDKKNYKYQDGLGIDDKFKVTGLYEINDNTITLQSPTKTSEIYIKDDYLCADKDCNTIYTKTDNNCEINK